MKRRLTFLLLLVCFTFTGAVHSQLPDGLPPFGAGWGAADFRKGLEILYNQEPGQVMNVHSDSLLRYLTDPGNYSFLDDTAVELEKRAESNLELTGIVKQMLLVDYGRGTGEDGKLKAEGRVSRLLVLLCSFTGRQSEMADQFIETHPDLNATQLEGLAQMSTGMAQMLDGLLVILEKESKAYSDESLCRLARGFTDLNQRFRAGVDADVVAAYDGRATALARSHPLNCVRAALGR